MLSPDSWIGYQLAERAGVGVCRRVIRQLQAIPKVTSDILPHLQTTWDEICIQVQGEQSIMWDAYVDEMQLRLRRVIDRLPRLEREAMWMQTDAGRDWEYDEARSDNNPLACTDNIVDVLCADLLGFATDWNNAALRAQKAADEGTRYAIDN